MSAAALKAAQARDIVRSHVKILALLQSKQLCDILDIISV
jgi:hypothetical protein